MQTEGQGQSRGEGQKAEGERRQHLTKDLREAVLRGQADRVNQLLDDAAPLVTDTVRRVFSFRRKKIKIRKK